MATRRMFNIEILESDKFLELSNSAKILYFYLCLGADDDGINAKKKKTEAMTETTKEAYNELLSSGFIYDIDDVSIVKHWKLHNQIKRDRYRETIYSSVKSHLELKDNIYEYKTEPRRNQDGTKTEPKDSIDKISIDKCSIDEKRKDESMREESTLSQKITIQDIKNIDSSHVLNDTDIDYLYNYIKDNQISNYVPIVIRYIQEKDSK